MGEQVNLGRVVGEYAKINDQPVTNISGSNGIKSEQHGSQVIFSGDPDTVQMNLGGTPNQYVAFDISGKAVPFELYGFGFDNQESDPESKIRYIGNHKNYQPARMGSSTFDYGDWGNAWFIKNLKPCMLNYDGTVAYDLDKNDYTKKADGTESDVANESFSGNAMIGVPTVWIKVDNTDEDMPIIYFSNIQVDSDYHAYAHHDNAGHVMPYTYLPIYNGWVDSNGRLRSLSGKAPTNAQSGTAQITEARANNPSGTDIWDIEKLVDRNLINLLIMLICKTTNTQAAFGYGNVTGNTTPASGSGSHGIMPTGALNTAGLFWGSTSAKNMPVKVFGIENWWGNLSRVTMGFANRNKNIYYKLTRGTEDGSSVYGFDPDALGVNSTPSGWITKEFPDLSNGYIQDVTIDQNGVLIPCKSGASDSTYMCDIYTSAGNGMIPFLGISAFGGLSSSDSASGAFCLDCGSDITSSTWNRSACCSCKPNVS